MTTIGDTLTPEQRAKLGVNTKPEAAEDDWLSGATACSIENGADCEACQ